MKLWAGVAVTSTLLTSVAWAADLPVRSSPPLGVPAPVFLQWDGFYTGADFGYQETRAHVREPGARGRFTLTGYSGGSFLGRNWQFGSFVAGLEGYVSVHETKGRLAVGPTTGAQGDHLYNAGAKARFGYALGSLLPYVTVGVATSRFHQHSASGPFDEGDVRQATGLTAGAGLEYAFTRNISARVDFEYYTFGRETYVHDGVAHRTSFDGYTIKGGLVLRESPDGPAAGLLSGLLGPGRGYGGVLVGAGFGRADFERPNGARTRFDVEGVEGGIFGGYNLLLGQGFFVGYDSFATVSGIGGRGTGAAGAIGTDLMWSGATRLRGGMTVGPLQPYLVGGFTLAQEETRNIASGRVSVEMLYGGTIGAGVDYSFGDRWFARAEYAYSRYKANHPKLDAGIDRLSLDRHDARFGIGYRL